MTELILTLILFLLVLQEYKRSKRKLPKAQSSTSLYPVNDFIAIRPIEDEDPDKFIDDKAPPPLKGEVVGVGTGTAVIKMQVRLGQTVYYQRVANATRIPLHNDELLFMRQSDLIGYEETQTQE